MKKTGVRVMASLLSLIMVFLTACGSNKEAGAEQTSNGQGRYVEEEYGLPDGVSMVAAMNILSDGTVRMICVNGIYDSKDGGRSWEKSGLEDFLIETGAIGILSACIDKEGNLFLSVYEEAGIAYYYVDHQGEIRKVDVSLPEIDFGGVTGGTFGSGNAGTEDSFSQVQGMEGDSFQEEGAEGDLSQEQVTIGGEFTQNEVSEGEMEFNVFNAMMNIQFTSDGNMVATDMMGALYLIDVESGEILNTYVKSGAGSISAFACIGEKLAVYTGYRIELYDLASGDLLEADEVLNSFFTAAAAEDSGTLNQVIMGDGDDFIMTQGNSAEELFFMDNTGLYRYTFGSGAVEEVLNGSLYSMSAPSYSFQNLLAKEDNTFLIAYHEISNMSVSAKLMNYVYDTEVGAVPSKELTIYTLEDNQNIRQAITQFQRIYPDYYIKLEIGMGGDDAMTVSDALRALNTDILGGTGPDILLLDGMPVDSYIEKGLLYDLGEAIETIAAENNFFEKVLYMNKTGEGFYAVPTRFSIPVIAGLSENLSRITGLNTLSAATEALRLENQDIPSILGSYTGEQLVELFYNTSSGAFIKEDGTLDEGPLTDFLTRVKEIYEQNASEGFGNEDSIIGADSVLRNLITILSNEQLLSAEELTGISELNTLISINKEVGWDYQLLSGQAGSTFIPMDMVGVNAKSENIEASLEIVKSLLSLDLQKISQSPGFPVNVDAFDELCQEQLNASGTDSSMSMAIGIMTDDGQSKSIAIEPGTQEDYAQLKKYLEAVDTPANTNEIIRNAVLEGASGCMTGDVTVEKAVSNIMKKINLYLAE